MSARTTVLVVKFGGSPNTDFCLCRVDWQNRGLEPTWGRHTGAWEGLVADRLPRSPVRAVSRATHQRKATLVTAEAAWLAELEGKRKQLARCSFLCDLVLEASG